MKNASILLVLFALVGFCKKPSAPHATKNPPAYFKVIEKQGLNLREEPTVKSKRISTLPYGTVGKIIHVSPDYQVIQNARGSWLHVEVGPTKGFIFSGFVLLSDSQDFSASLRALNQARTANLNPVSEELLKGFEKKEAFSYGDATLELYEFANSPDRIECNGLPKHVVLRQGGALYGISIYGDREEVLALHQLRTPLNNTFITMAIRNGCSCAQSRNDVVTVIAQDQITNFTGLGLEDEPGGCFEGNDIPKHEVRVHYAAKKILLKDSYPNPCEGSQPNPGKFTILHLDKVPAVSSEAALTDAEAIRLWRAGSSL